MCKKRNSFNHKKVSIFVKDVGMIHVQWKHLLMWESEGSNWESMTDLVFYFSTQILIQQKSNEIWQGWLILLTHTQKEIIQLCKFFRHVNKIWSCHLEIFLFLAVDFLWNQPIKLIYMLSLLQNFMNIDGTMLFLYFLFSLFSAGPQE